MENTRKTYEQGDFVFRSGLVCFHNARAEILVLVDQETREVCLPQSSCNLIKETYDSPGYAPESFSSAIKRLLQIPIEGVGEPGEPGEHSSSTRLRSLAQGFDIKRRNLVLMETTTSSGDDDLLTVAAWFLADFGRDMDLKAATLGCGEGWHMRKMSMEEARRVLPPHEWQIVQRADELRK
ncbi:hypothetical protein MMC24_004553 [Lignoscripta atroalba]|nr:hypothetical protein [Lignoscripta atroalba]